MTQPAFRRATAADVPALVALIESAYRGDASRVGWTTEADLLDGQRTDPDDIATRLARPDSRFILAEQDGAGLVASVLVTREADGGVYFGMLAVRPGLQGAGLGKALLAEVERVARDDFAATTLRMQVIAQRAELIAYYERRGFARTGETAPFPYGDERFGKPRRDDLVFVVMRKAL